MRKPQVEGHWHSLIEGFATSSPDFYELVRWSGRRAVLVQASARTCG
jgi:hypothetical protein